MRKSEAKLREEYGEKYAAYVVKAWKVLDHIYRRTKPLYAQVYALEDRKRFAEAAKIRAEADRIDDYAGHVEWWIELASAAAREQDGVAGYGDGKCE